MDRPLEPGFTFPPLRGGREGEVSPSYGDGGVMGDAQVPHSPEVDRPFEHGHAAPADIGGDHFPGLLLGGGL